MEYIIGILLLISFVGLAVYAVRGGNMMMGMMCMFSMCMMMRAQKCDSPCFIPA